MGLTVPKPAVVILAVSASVAQTPKLSEQGPKAQNLKP